MSATLCWVDIPVTDLDRAAAFYSAVFGVKIDKHSFGPNFELAVLPGVERGPSGCLVGSPLTENRPSQSGPLIYLNVEGRLDQAIAAVRRNGGAVVQEKESIAPHGFRALIIDTEGNRVALHSNKD